MKALESQNQPQFEEYLSRGGVVLGPYSSHIFRSDPRHLLFLLARYKFAAKMLDGKSRVLEVGCGDAFGTPIVMQAVDTVHAIDIEPLVIQDNASRNPHSENCSFEVLDITLRPTKGIFDAAFSLDVIEHIPASLEEAYFSNICRSLERDGIFVLGTPNKAADAHASEYSRIGHINLKGFPELKEVMERHFFNVLLFSMNDELVHTGFYPMAHYLIAVGIGPRNSAPSKQ